MDVSIKGRRCGGRWYPRPDRYVIFVNKIAEAFDPDTNLDKFLAEFLAIEFHELGHIYGFRTGCRSRACLRNLCYWCLYTDFMNLWFQYRVFPIDFKLHLKDKINKMNRWHLINRGDIIE